MGASRGQFGLSCERALSGQLAEWRCGSATGDPAPGNGFCPLTRWGELAQLCREPARWITIKYKQGVGHMYNWPKNFPPPLLFVRRTSILLQRGNLLPPMPSLGVSSLDLGRLWQRRRPLYFILALLSRSAYDGRFWRGTETCRLTGDVNWNTFNFSGNFAADALLGRFLPRPDLNS